MNEPTVTITLREFNELKSALDAAIALRCDQVFNKDDSRYEEWMRDLYVWRDMRIDYKKGMK